jgi:subtilisin family serine protease
MPEIARAPLRRLSSQSFLAVLLATAVSMLLLAAPAGAGVRYVRAGGPAQADLPGGSGASGLRVASIVDPELILAEVGATDSDQATTSSASSIGSPRYVPGRIIVKLDPATARRSPAGIGEGPRRRSREFGIGRLDVIGQLIGVRYVERPYVERAARLARRSGGPSLRGARAPIGSVPAGMDRVWIVGLDEDADVEAAAATFAAIPGVEWAEPDGIAHTVFATNDPYLSSSGAWKQSFPDLWGLANIDAQTAWDTTRGAGVVVAITDTGIDTAHPDISANVWHNAGEIPGNGVDDDGNGYIDDTEGWDFAYDDDDPFDDFGHGTHVAGTVAAVGNNAIGIAGVAWQAQVMALKGLDASGSGAFSDLAEAIIYAVDNGADVINASWGAAGESDVVSDAIQTAEAAGVVFVAAAGNSATDASTFFPAADRASICVSAVDSNDTLAWFSNYGTTIDVAAPGGGDGEPSNVYDPYRSVLSLRSSGANGTMTSNGKLVVDDDYVRQAGTSMAAPHVAGLAALILADHPEFTVREVRNVIRASADDVGDPGNDRASGYGRIDAAAAVAIPSALEVTIDAPARDDVLHTNGIEVTGSAFGTDFATYQVDFGRGDYPTSWTPIVGPTATPIVAGTLASWDASSVPDDRYTIRVSATTTFGDTFEDRVQITLDRVEITEPASYTESNGGGAPIEIRGTAYAPGFTGYTIEYRQIGPDLVEGPWETTGITLTGGGATAVVDDVLGTFDGTTLATGRELDFRLTVDGSSGGNPVSESEVYYHVVVDPDLAPGWPVLTPAYGLFNPYRLEEQPNVADLDGDGTKEILVAYDTTVYVWRYDGTDFPGWPVSVDTGDPDTTGFMLHSPTVADLDNDGHLEVVAGDGIYVHVWHDDGTPYPGWPRNFVGGHDNSSDYGRPYGGITLADLDGDGFRDIILPVGDKIEAVDRNGDPLPGWPVEVFNILISPPPIALGLAVGDVDGDGRKEVAAVEHTAGHRKDYLHVFSHDGTELPKFPRKIASHRVDDNVPIMVDLDQDGLLDVVANDFKPKKLAAYHGTGKKARLRTRVPAFTKKVYGAGRFDSAQEPVTAGDITGDGVPEVFVTTEYPQPRRRCGGGRCTTTILLTGTGGTDIIQPVSTTERRLDGWPIELFNGDYAHGPGQVAIGDIDGDGMQNVVAHTGMCVWYSAERYDRCYTLYAFEPDGSIVPGFPKPTAAPSPTAVITPAIADLDGDGLMEIVSVDLLGYVLVWKVPGTPGPENVQWPVHRHDPGRTAALQ